MLCCKSADIDFVLVFPILFACRTLFCTSLFACVFGPKNVPKTLEKRRPNPSKIDAKNVLFFNIDFSGFGPRFWSLLGLEDGAKIAIMAPKSWLCAPPWAVLSWRYLKHGVLEGSGFDFGGSKARFQSSKTQFYDDLYQINCLSKTCFPNKLYAKCRKCLRRLLKHPNRLCIQEI